MRHVANFGTYSDLRPQGVDDLAKTVYRDGKAREQALQLLTSRTSSVC